MINVSKIKNLPDGTAEIHYELSDEFVEWFKKSQNLKRFSKARFRKWATNALKEGLDMLEEKND